VHPSLKSCVAPPLPRALRYLKEARGKASAIIMIGECGDVLKEAPYVLERIIDSYENVKDVSVKGALLTATVKLFFQRPPEVQMMLGKLLAKTTEDDSSQDLHDRALLYYRLLRTSDLNVVKNVVNTESIIIGGGGGGGRFSEEKIDDGIRDSLMKEFNTLSILYGTTSENFIAEEHQVRFVMMPPEHPLNDGAESAVDPGVNEMTEQMGGGMNLCGGNSGATSDLIRGDVSGGDLMGDRGGTQPVAPNLIPTLDPVQPPIVDLLGFGDESATTSPVSITTGGSIVLDVSFTLAGDEYQTKWGSIPDDVALESTVVLRVPPTSTDDIERPLSSIGVMTMASGELPTEFKFFFYAKDNGDIHGLSGTGHIFMVQAVISKGNGMPGEGTSMTLTVKMSSGEGGNDVNQRERMLSFVNVIRGAIS